MVAPVRTNVNISDEDWKDSPASTVKNLKGFVSAFELKNHLKCPGYLLTSLVSLLSPPKINNIFKLEVSFVLPSLTLWLHYLGKLMALLVKLTFYPTLLSMWITAMPSISALGARLG
jgi:hypothetical protein